MPVARAFSLQKLMASLQECQRNNQQKILIDYIILDGVNNEEQHAYQSLCNKSVHIVSTISQVVNLIPFNSIGMLSQFKPTTEQKVWAFHKILRGMYNIQTKIRKQMGQDISGACGQLVVNVPDKSLGNAEPLTIIEDLFI
nr:uncharacterized protein LOC112729142 [Arachis hypogaea]